jgi:excisionase family DNA binding protein
MNIKSSNQLVVAGCGIAVRKFSKAKVVAERLGVCPRTIFRWANDGKIARHKINARVVLFDEAEVLALVEAARIQCC